MAIRDYRFDNLPRTTQILVFAILISCLAAGFYFYYLKDLVRKRNAIQTEIARLEAVVAQATAIETKLRQFKSDLARLEQRLAVLQSILPAEKETPTILRSVQDMAKASNLKILEFTPKPVIPRSFYSDWPILIEVEGNYNGLGTFFERVGHATRIIDVGGISIKGVDNSPNPMRTLSARCTATTFVFSEDQLAAAEKEETQQ